MFTLVSKEIQTTIYRKDFHTKLNMSELGVKRNEDDYLKIFNDTKLSVNELDYYNFYINTRTMGKDKIRDIIKVTLNREL